jgi:hypothetical protein
MKNQHLLDVYKNNYQYIAGWFDIKFLEELLKLNQIHEKKNIKGNLLEIGVYESKSFIPLSFLLKSNEQIIGIDLFSPIEDLNNGICLNSLNRAEMNLKKIYRQNIKDLNYKLIKENSKNLKSNHYLGYVNNNLNYRIIYIDGNHSYDYVQNDLEQSKNIIIKDGYIICDDYGLSEFPEVKKAVDDFLLENKNFKVNSFVYNKLVMTNNS